MRLLLAALLLLSAAGSLRAERRPNVVIILADDLGWGDVGFNGRTTWATPNLDRLAREGTAFTRWYTAAPVCAPSRAALLTGKYGIHSGVRTNGDDLPREEVTLAEALRARGYATALFGKWHQGRPSAGEDVPVHPLDHGFDEFSGFTDARHAWEHFPAEIWQGREKVPVERRYADSRFADLAIDFIRRKRAAPFFLLLSFTTSHFHIEAPPEDVAEHRGKFPEKDQDRPLHATYAAMVTRLDREVGRVLGALGDARLTDDTIVVFTSDNGATFEAGNMGTSSFHDSNAPFRGHKRTLWEGGIRVPGAVRWPGRIAAGSVSEAPIHMIDLFPTLLAAAGGEPDPAWKVAGRNVLSSWRGRDAGPERTLFWEWRAEGHEQLAALRGDLKLVITRGGRPELFDLSRDPAERRDLAPGDPKRVKEMEDELAAWLATAAPPREARR